MDKNKNGFLESYTPALEGEILLRLSELVHKNFFISLVSCKESTTHVYAYCIDQAPQDDFFFSSTCLFTQDELLWGAAWLRRASQDDSFLNYIQNNGKILGADDNINEFGWDNKHAGLNVLVSKV